ncbi:putative RNA-binding protein [Trypanosoma cruzi]|uniref:Putative RNA-binding protein n=1 Tax=Trypanosoma cruzi TaxID=5693 RepID=A0A2V2X6R4_TRYCR|nr:putative RNA-binding protein [Trypanosoma cruzi]
MSSFQLFSRTCCCLFFAAPTVKMAMRRAVLLCSPLSPPFSSSSSSSSSSSAAAFFNGRSATVEEQKQTSDGGRDVDLALRLQDQLAKISEKVAHDNDVIRQQATAFAMLQRQQVVLERRVVAVEEETVQMQQKIAETTRVASDVVLQHRNVEALVRQMEKLVLSHASSPKNTKSSSGIASQAEEAKSNALGVSTNPKLMTTPSYTSPSFPSSASSMGNSAVAGMGAQISALSTRLEALQARIEQLTLENLVLNNVQLHAQKLQKDQQQQQSLVEEAVSRVAAAAEEECGGGSGTGSGTVPTGHSTKSLATLLRNTGAFPFKDSTGATRVSSQKVLVRGVPVNFGASEVRDLFSCVGSVVSCVVRRMPVAPVATKARPHVSRYRSQQKQQEEKEACEGETTDGPTSGGSAANFTTSTAEENERVFEVTYQKVEEAVRAILQLDEYQLHGKHILSVEPVVSADIVAAMQHLERELNRR